MKAIVLGATGQVGGAILTQLLADDRYQQVYAAGRSSVLALPDHPKLEKIVIDYQHPQFAEDILAGAHLFFAVGTGNRDLFAHVDYGYALAMGQVAAGKVASFNLVSAMGASSRAPLHYLRVKGLTEEALSQLYLGQLRFYRPAQLLAPQRSDLGRGEAFSISFFGRIEPLLRGPLTNWRGISPQQVAQSMVENAASSNPQRVYTYQQMIGG